MKMFSKGIVKGLIFICLLTLIGFLYFNSRQSITIAEGDVKDSTSGVKDKIAIKNKERKKLNEITEDLGELEYISIIGDGVKYKPTNIDEEWIEDVIEYDKIDIPLGASRIGGPVVDLPEDISYPEDMYFAAQLSMDEIVQYDKESMLPTLGFLYVFIDNDFNGKVLYSESSKDELKRVTKEHEEQFFIGQLIKGYNNATESLDDRYDEEWDEPDSASVMGWDAFYGYETTKIYGMYNNCQISDEEIISVINSDKIVLLQIGENFTDEGVLNILIDKEDLKKRDFTKCEVEWVQS